MRFWPFKRNKKNEDETKPKKGKIREHIELFTSALFIALLIRVFLVDNNEIPTGSMIPNILEGDRLFVNRFLYGVRLPVLNNWKLPALGSPDPGDVVVFQYPLYESPGVIREILDLMTFSFFGLDPQPKNFVKRLIGLPGDRIRLDKRGVLYINGKKVKRRFYQSRTVKTYSKGGRKRKIEIYAGNKKIYDYTKIEYSSADAVFQSNSYKGQFLGSENYTLYKENGRIVQYLQIVDKLLDTSLHLLRPYPKAGMDEYFYKKIAEMYIRKNMLQGKGTVVVAKYSEWNTLKNKDVNLFLYNRRGEAWYRLKGQKKLNKLFEMIKGHLYVVVPKDSYFMMGDNRDFSADSRIWGFVKKGYVTGAPLIRYWPFGRFGTVD